MRVLGIETSCDETAVAVVEATGLATLLDRAALADERPLLGHDRIREDWQRRWAALRARNRAS